MCFNLAYKNKQCATPVAVFKIDISLKPTFYTYIFVDEEFSAVST